MPTDGSHMRLPVDTQADLTAPHSPFTDVLPSGMAAAVLEALPYCIAVLDHSGAIVSVNDHWRCFVREHGAAELAENSIGLHFRKAWGQAFRPRGPLGENVPKHIQAVVDGALPAYSVEYSCAANPQRRWYLLRAIQLAAPAGGAVILHIDITERKRAEAEREHLLKKEHEARALAESAYARMQQLQALTDAALGHLSLAELVPTLSARVQRLMAVDDVSIFLLGEDGHTLTLDHTSRLFNDVHPRIPLGRGVVGRIALTRKPVIIEDLSKVEVAYPIVAERLRSLAGVPLLAEENLVGVLHVGTTTLRKFSEDDLQLLRLAADRIARALDRARLYDLAQAARQEAEARAGELRATFEAMSDAVVVCDTKRQVIQANHAYRELMTSISGSGSKLTPLQERSADLDIRDEHDHPLSQAMWPIPRLLRGDVMRGESTLDVRTRFADGHERDFNISGAPVRDAEGRIRAAIAVLRDMTEHRRLERRTQEALDALVEMAQTLSSLDSVKYDRSALETSEVTRRLVRVARRVLGCERVMLMTVDPQTMRMDAIASAGCGRVVERRWRSQLARDLQRDDLTVELLRAQSLGRDVLCESHSTAHLANTTYGESALVLAPLRLTETEVGLLVLDYGKESSRASAKLLSGIADLAALVLQRDRLWREREQARANERALQRTTQRMEEFLATASHDLRTPLSATVGFTDIAGRQFRQLATAMRETHPDLLSRLTYIQTCIEEAAQGGQRLSRLVDLLFDTSSLRAEKLELRCTRFNLTTLARELVKAIQVSAQDRTIHFDAPSRAIDVEADIDRIGQVITNYITNALKYSPVDQPVTVRLTAEHGYARVAVADRGPGLPLSERERIWQPYYRSKGVEAHGGSKGSLGLGLHICKTIIERHNGEVGVESEVGEGSSFWFTLPLSPRAEGDQAAVPCAAKSGASQR